ncbi:NAD(P)/FAD-dependent oxidoreductase [Halorarum salinum]|uniref:FAD-binding oxidoreductase n=1 Tax=Halorarum salinum TaxID=2743089 RepID=A0A7D5L8E5_9EURY|nr:FAD-dependent oxidoreductase [Halobaculum salinum]QLG60434.1 FAD-binding oxidoreductase [Halobaculum salinum]
MDVVVVGGGIVGLSSAYYLGRAGAEVTLCERDALGTRSTARSAGGIRSQFSTEVNVRLSLASREVWDAFEADFGVDVAHRRHGYLLLAREEATASRFREHVAMQNDLGVGSEYLSPAEAAERCPELHDDRFVGATYHADDGYADPNLAVQGYAAAARESGVDVRTRTEVTDVLTDGADGRAAPERGTDEPTVTGVETADGRIEADRVVNAAGAWAARLAAMVGVDLPIRPRRRQIAVVEPGVTLPGDVPLTIDLDACSYFRPEREGAALVGGHFAAADPDVDPDRYSKSLDLDWAATAVERAADCADYFGADSRIKSGWAGLYAVTPDHHPVIEETLPGLVTAAGFSGHGFQHAPATGKLVAELCVDGGASLVDVDPLSSRRFEEGGRLVERNVA